MIKVVVVDDQALVRSGLVVLLGAAPDIEVVGEASDGIEALAVIRMANPDVALIDIRMPRLDGIATTRRVTADSSTATRVIILTTFDDDRLVFDAIQAGASGFLLKDSDPMALMNGVRVVHSGESLLAGTITRRLIERFMAEQRRSSDTDRLVGQLTTREREVLMAIASGASNVEIAELLGITHATVKTHVSRVLAKLGARDRVQLVINAYETGLVRPT